MLYFGNSVNLIEHMISKFQFLKWSKNINDWIFVYSSVNNEELARFVRSLKVLEHCIQPFLNQCDTNNDNKISSDEWGTCLGLNHGNCQSISCPKIIFLNNYLFRWYGFLENILLTLTKNCLVNIIWTVCRSIKEQHECVVLV